ncbi:TPA_asm: PAPS reductase [Porphyromonas phage phage022a_WW2931]|uniref:PAPS reductase n=1 Tax=Porphyromonas phage phage022a_WW2931 TaxID=3154112 RepID=A0AAT9J8T1_9CAUD
MIKVLVSFSGGKDSQACLILAAERWGKDNITAVFCDTGWEHPATYKHIEEITKNMKVDLVTLRSTQFEGFVDLAKKKGRFPSTRARFCTVELKVKPMIDFILSLDCSCIIVQGIRAKESYSRAQMLPECSYFKEYFSEKGGLHRSREVLDWCKQYDASVLRPIFSWSADDVVSYILRHGQRPNPLYEKGFARVGCYPCVMCRLSDLSSMDVDGRVRLMDAEKEVGRTFFSVGRIPARFCRNGEYPTAEEAIAYAEKKYPLGGLFEEIEENYACMSLYHGLCE